jgi:methionine-rich copper-binding protein CopC
LHRRKLKILIASLFISGYVLISPVFAHADLESASPAADELVTTWPKEVVLQFNEDLITTQEQQVNFVSVTDVAD